MNENLVYLVLLILLCSSTSIDGQVKEGNVKLPQINDLECVSGPELKYFRSHSPKHNVVAGEEISYNVKGLSGTNWIYKLGTGLACDHTFSNYWQVAPDQGVTPKNKGKGIRTTLPLPASNRDFGAANGTVQVEVDGTYDCFPDARVFFDKDATNNPDGTVPNWFYYWRQLLAHDDYSLPVYNDAAPDNPTFSVTPIMFVYRDDPPYNWNPGGNINYGKTEIVPMMVPIDYSVPSGPRYALSYDINMNLGEGCSKLCGHELQVTKDPSGNIVSIVAITGTGDTGIDCFNQVFYHEFEHIVIFSENWSKGYTNGLDWDMDNDDYSDQFEIDHISDGFRVGVNDSYGLGPGSAGWDYEENRCRGVEDNLPQSLFISADDWSFDKTNDYQGKNWK